MNIQQINDNLQIKDFLEKSGIMPANQKGNNYWYISPIRETESTPSFKVDAKRNRWYDFGTGEGGKLFDLARRLYGSNDLSEVIGKVTGLFLISTANSGHLQGFTTGTRQSNIITENGTNENCNQAYSNDWNGNLKQHSTGPSSTQSNRGHDKNENLSGSPRTVISKVESLGRSYNLIRYLSQRGISRQTASAYCGEVSFSISDKRYSAIGFENRSGGYELRNEWFKGASSPKDITFIASGSNAVCLVEGFMDFLSLVELRDQLQLNANFLVLNSVALLGKSLDILRAHRDVFLFLDHDKAGRETADKLAASGIQGIDSSGFYSGFKDVNEYLVSGHARQETRSGRRR